MKPEHTATDQERIDEAAAESFPASDPPSWNAGLSHEQVHLSTELLLAKIAWQDNWEQVKSMLRQEFGNLTDDDFLVQEGDWEEVLVRLQKRLSKTRQEIEDLLII